MYVVNRLRLCVLTTSFQEDAPVPEADKATLRRELVPAIISLSNASDKTIRAPVAETISLIASSDFPEKWSDLIDVSYGGVNITGTSFDPCCIG